MAKAILIMEMPRNCAECDLCDCIDGLKHYCIPDDFRHLLEGKFLSHEFENRPDWCPLKPIPNKMITSSPPKNSLEIWNNGWNACIDAICGKRSNHER